MWDLIVSVPDHCSSFYFPLPNEVLIRRGISYNIIFDDARIQYKLYTIQTTVYLQPQIYIHPCHNLASAYFAFEVAIMRGLDDTTEPAHEIMVLIT